MAKSISNNRFALCIIILIVLGLFLHYEMGFGKGLNLFSVGGNKRNKGWGPNHKWHHHCTSDDDPNKHTGGSVHSATVYSV